MDNIRMGILALFGVGIAAVSAYMHVNNQDGSGWGLAAGITWLVVLFNI